MTKEEKDLALNTVRVGGNLLVLIDVGLFPGKHSVGIAECYGFVKAIVDDAQRRLESLTPPAPAVTPEPAKA